jgi:hypothetical protein
MAQAVSRQPLTVKAQVCAQISPCGICGGQSGTGTFFFSELFSFPMLVSFHCGCPYSYITWGMNRPIGSCSSETESHSTNMNNSTMACPACLQGRWSITEPSRHYLNTTSRIQGLQRVRSRGGLSTVSLYKIVLATQLQHFIICNIFSLLLESGDILSASVYYAFKPGSVQYGLAYSMEWQSRYSLFKTQST